MKKDWPDDKKIEELEKDRRLTMGARALGEFLRNPELSRNLRGRIEEVKGGAPAAYRIAAPGAAATGASPAGRTGRGVQNREKKTNAAAGALLKNDVLAVTRDGSSPPACEIWIPSRQKPVRQPTAKMFK